MNNQQWDYKIDGKTNGMAKNVIFIVISAIFCILTIDQLQAKPNKSIIAAFFFGSIAIISLYFLITSFVRYYCFKVYIGNTEFYYQTNPFNKTYYAYTDIKSCREELKTRQSGHHASMLYYYFFYFTENSGKTSKFLFDKSVYEHEINMLKKRIESNKEK